MKIGAEVLTLFGMLNRKDLNALQLTSKNFSGIDRGGCIDKSGAGYEFYDGKK